MQLLRQVVTEGPAADREDLTAALRRLERALSLLESRLPTV
jgi:hypothetical protein